jgi:hypothetical protein
MDTLAKILKVYIGIGVVVLAIQVTTARYLEAPACAGILSYVMVDRAFPRLDDSTILANTATGKPDPRSPMDAVFQVVRWAPDFYSLVIAGDMSVAEYFRGGAVCLRYPRL